MSNQQTGTTVDQIGHMRSETDGIVCVWDWVEEIVGIGLHCLGSGEGHGTTRRAQQRPQYSGRIRILGWEENKEMRLRHGMRRRGSEDERMGISRQMFSYIVSGCVLLF